ncbi:MAG TPA: ATPase domain-containing protein [Acidimicrobiales bacterium]|nr:ATPase domain-containing protein [Acidimicrobiales bacterium]
MKTHSVHVCRECGTTSPRWSGRCSGCGEWNTLDEERTTRAPRATTTTTSLRDVAATTAAVHSTGVGELDRVLGGGFIAGSTTLLFGEPGVGKSTLALMSLRALAERATPVLLIAAEESVAQVAQRARRLGDVPAGLDVAATTNVEAAEQLLRDRRPTLYVVDSISAMSDDAVGAVAGSVSQIRRAAERLCSVAKETGVALLIVGHVTKDGELAGPRTLEHLVDTVIRIEGDRHGTLRLLRALKHRFGATGEVGLLEMVPDGLREMVDATVLRGPALGVPGVVFTVTNDGSRSFLIEMQALVATGSGSPRRVAHQVSSQRLALLLAVLESRCAIDTSACDVFAATAGGLPANEPGVDVALALAVASAVLNFAVPRTVAVMGEVGLAGELRAVTGLSRRVREAQRLGATLAVVPSEGELEDVTGVEVIRCRTLAEAIVAAQSGTN